MTEAHAERCIGVAVADPALRGQIMRWLLDERWPVVEGALHPRAVAVLADRQAWVAQGQDSAASAVPWILLDDDPAWRSRLAALREGVRHFLAVPVTRDALLRALRNAGIEPDAAPPRVLVAGGVRYGDPRVAALVRAGADVQRAVSGDRLFELLGCEPTDVLLLCDGVDGVSTGDLMRLIRADASYDGVMMLALLARPDDACELPAGASFLIEPVTAEALRDAVFDRSRRRRRLQAAEASLQRVLALQEQERAALDAHALVSISDAAGTIIYANDHLCRVSGWSRDELIGRHHRVAKSEAHAPQVYAELWRTISGGGIWQGELCNRRKDGSTYWVATTIMPLSEGNSHQPVQYLAIRTDVTAQKEAQFALARQIERLEQMSRLAGVGSWEYEVAAKRLRWSAQTGRILGRPAGNEAVCADVLRQFDGVDARGQVREAFAAALREGAPLEFELPLRTVQGEPCWVRLLAVAQREGVGVARLVGAIQDVTAVRQTTLALQSARDEADRANRAKSEFLSTMSHELRTPMNAILGFGQLLDLDLGLGSVAHRHVGEILRAGHHLLALIDDVLDLARVESGRLDLALEPVLIAAVVDDCLRLAQPLATRRGIGVRVDVDGHLTVQADRVRLRQVLMNLLSNAIKYNAEGGRIEVSATDGASRRVRVSVRDTGCGIPPQRFGELFQPFNRLGAERGPVEGTGIGLVIVRRLVESMHGEMGVTSAPGVGSTFWIELPSGTSGQAAACVEAVGPGPRQPDMPPAGTRRCVLCVDDNASNLRLIERIFARWPAVHLLSTQDPALGLELALAQRPDLILLDLQMRPIDGFELLARLRAEPWLRAVPVVAITADAMPTSLARVRDAGFDDCLVKPFDLQRFGRVVERLLQPQTGAST